MIRRVRAAGFEVWFVPGAAVRHQMPAGRTTFRYAARHAFDSARSRVIDRSGRPGAAGYLLGRFPANAGKALAFALLRRSGRPRLSPGRRQEGAGARLALLRLSLPDPAFAGRQNVIPRDLMLGAVARWPSRGVGGRPSAGQQAPGDAPAPLVRKRPDRAAALPGGGRSGRLRCPCLPPCPFRWSSSPATRRPTCPAAWPAYAAGSRRSSSRSMTRPGRKRRPGGGGRRPGAPDPLAGISRHQERRPRARPASLGRSAWMPTRRFPPRCAPAFRPFLVRPDRDTLRRRPLSAQGLVHRPVDHATAIGIPTTACA